MKRSILLRLLIALGLVSALAGTITIVGRVRAQGPGPQGPSSAKDAVGTAFTYQGRLLEGTSPFTGNLDFTFTLHDSASGGDPLTECSASGVEVRDGYFSVPLDFGVDAFTGGARYLAIEVQDTILEPLVPLLPAPYAHSLRPGAVVASNSCTALTLTSSGVGATLSVSNAAHDGLLVTSAGDDGLQVSSANYGVYVNSVVYDALNVNSAGDDGLDIYNAGDAPTHRRPVDIGFGDTLGFYHSQTHMLIAIPSSCDHAETRRHGQATHFSEPLKAKSTAQPTRVPATSCCKDRMSVKNDKPW